MQAVHLHRPQNVFQHQPIQFHPKYVRKVPSFTSDIRARTKQKKHIFLHLLQSTIQSATNKIESRKLHTFVHKKKPKTNNLFYIRIHLQSILFCTHPPNSTSSKHPFLLPLKPNERPFSSPPKSFQYLSMYDCHQ